MSTVSVREILVAHLSDGLSRKDLSPEDINDETDFFAERLIDSFGLLELILALEERFQVTIDLENMDGDDFTRVGPFCAYVEGLTQE